MFEHSSLQETYTGALIGGKGRGLNNIRIIMTHSKFPTSDWVRVRFGAGTPWRRCWCVITPPDEKEVAKAQKSSKKRSTYDRAQITLKGDVRFYETRKITKKTQAIATINNAYAAYAIYPQSKALIEQSTLIKIEGNVTINTNPPTRLESFIFVMPEAHDAVTGFEMLVRFLFPIWDVFALYGRPQRLIPDTWNPKSLMFAMPKHDRWGYLDIMDVTTLVTRPGSANWSEAEWKRELKKLTAEHIEKIAQDPNQNGSRPASQYGHMHRNSLPSRSGMLKFADDPMADSRTSLSQEPNGQDIAHLNSGSTSQMVAPLSSNINKGHGRSTSESVSNSPQRRAQDEYLPPRLSKEASRPSQYSGEDSLPPLPPAHVLAPALIYGGVEGANAQHDSSEDEHNFHDTPELQTEIVNGPLDMNSMVDKPPSPVEPVAAPPAFSHQPGEKPHTRPYHSPELRRANSRMSTATLSQLAAATSKQSLRDGNTEGDDQRLGRTNDPHDRSNPMMEQNFNRSTQLSDQSATIYGQRSDSGSPSNSGHLQAPYQYINRSVSPLRHVAAMTPVEELQTPFFAENPFESQQNLNHSPSRQALVTPREQSTERPVSVGKIGRKPVPPSPSRLPTEFVSAGAVVLTRDVESTIVNRMDTIHSKASTASRRYSGDGSNYDSDSPGHEAQPHPFHVHNTNSQFNQSGNALPVLMGDGPAVQQSENWQVHPDNSSKSLDVPDTNLGRTLAQQPDLRTTAQATERMDGRTSTSHSPSRIPNMQSRSPTRSSLPIPNSGNISSGADENRPFAGQSGPSIIPEQFVHQRAAADRVPVYSQGSRPPIPDSNSWQDSSIPHLASANPGDWLPNSGHNNPRPHPHDITNDVNDSINHAHSREQGHMPVGGGPPHAMAEPQQAASHFQQNEFDGGVGAREQDYRPFEHALNRPTHQQAMDQSQAQIYGHQHHQSSGSQYHVPGQFPNHTPVLSDWEQSQQQEHPYDYPQSQAYGGPIYGRQEYYEQGNTSSNQPNQRQAYNNQQDRPNAGQPNSNNHAYRG